MIKLHRGITGFDAPQLPKHLLFTAIENIKKLQKYKILEVQEPSTSTNYYTVKIEHAIILLINAQHPYYCGVLPGSTWMNLHFTDMPEDIQKCFDGFCYLSPELLNSPFTEKDIEQLADSEKQQIRYWKTKTFGEVIFNGYD